MIELLRPEWGEHYFFVSDCPARPQSIYELANRVAVSAVPAAARLVERLNQDGWGRDGRPGVEVIQIKTVHDLTGETEVLYRVDERAHFQRGEVALIALICSCEFCTLEEAVETAVAYVQTVTVWGEQHRKSALKTAMKAWANYGSYLVGSGQVVVRYWTTTKTGKPRVGRHVFGANVLRVGARRALPFVSEACNG